ncbi:MAG: hypothetical protein A2Y15_08945 [Clostridiales bacterium GWF2_36_10]|nr:MAG: hypothetical protein A2Y15_08945 [Clostridiales bacterium GWF2_36_10]
MSKFIPFDKLSKKEQKEFMKKKRVTWGEFNPATRKPTKPKVYNRKKIRDQEDDNFGTSLFYRKMAYYAFIYRNNFQ